MALGTKHSFPPPYYDIAGKSVTTFLNKPLPGCICRESPIGLLLGRNRGQMEFLLFYHTYHSFWRDQRKNSVMCVELAKGARRAVFVHSEHFECFCMVTLFFSIVTYACYNSCFGCIFTVIDVVLRYVLLDFACMKATYWDILLGCSASLSLHGEG
jgi:hypothetical protein